MLPALIFFALGYIAGFAVKVWDCQR